MHRLAVAVATLAPLAAPGGVLAQGARTCEPDPAIASSRPDSAAPTEVAVGLFLIDLRGIDDARRTFNADLGLNLSWNDPRLVADGARSLAGCTLPLSSIWHPRAVVLNEFSLNQRVLDEVTIRDDGSVFYRQRLVGDLTFPFSLREFPFDRHDLEVALVSYAYGPEEVSFVVNRERSGRSEELSIADWSAGAGAMVSEPLYLASQGRKLSRISFTMEVIRQRGFFALKVFLPLTLIICMSFAGLWINPSYLPPRIGVATSAVLTLIAFQFSLGYLLPRLPYLTRGDRFVLGSTALVFLAFGETILASYLADRERKELALRIDRHARWLFPLGLLGVIAIAFSI